MQHCMSSGPDRDSVEARGILQENGPGLRTPGFSERALCSIEQGRARTLIPRKYGRHSHAQSQEERLRALELRRRPQEGPLVHRAACRPGQVPGAPARYRRPSRCASARRTPPTVATPSSAASRRVPTGSRATRPPGRTTASAPPARVVTRVAPSARPARVVIRVAPSVRPARVATRVAPSVRPVRVTPRAPIVRRVRVATRAAPSVRPVRVTPRAPIARRVRVATPPAPTAPRVRVATPRVPTALRGRAATPRVPTAPRVRAATRAAPSVRPVRATPRVPSARATTGATAPRVASTPRVRVATSRANREGYEPRENRSFGHDRDQRPATPQDDVVLARLEAQAVDATDMTSSGFLELGLGQNLVRALSELGADSPFPIQAATIPSVLEGRDVARPRPHRLRQDDRLRCSARRASAPGSEGLDRAPQAGPCPAGAHPRPDA